MEGLSSLPNDLTQSVVRDWQVSVGTAGTVGKEKPLGSKGS